jgi:hypothetical protein
VKRGDTFVWCPAGTVKDHLWIIISDPATHEGKLVVINLTESLGGKFSFVLKVGQHRWIYKDSDVNFGDAFATNEAFLQSEVKCGSARPHDPMDPSIVKAIIEAAHTHPAFQPILRKLLPKTA